jgi:hypothetical protein
MNKVFYIEQALELQIISGFNFVFPDGWHMKMNMLLGMLIGGTGEKPSSSWWGFITNTCVKVHYYVSLHLDH